MVDAPCVKLRSHETLNRHAVGSFRTTSLLQPQVDQAWRSWPGGALATLTLAVCRRGRWRPRHAGSRVGLLWAEPESSWFGRFFVPDTTVFKQSRQYSTPDALKKSLQGVPLNLSDLSRKNGPNVPVTSLEPIVYRIIAFSSAFLAYPSVVRFLRWVLQLGAGENMNDLNDVVQDFVTVETFVFGSYSGVTLTLQIQRLAELQCDCVRECALLSGLAEHTVELFDSLCKEALPDKTRESVLRNEKSALKAGGRILDSEVWASKMVGFQLRCTVHGL